MRFSKLSGIATGLVLIFAGQTFGHDIDPADSCSGYSCSTPGQQCGPGVSGAYNEAYVCSEEKQWVRVPSAWDEDPSLFALLFHDHDDAHDEIATMFGSEAPSTEAVQPANTEPTPAYVNKCAGWSCEQNGQICVEDVPVVLWGVDAGIFPNMLAEDIRYNMKHRNAGAYYLCSDNAWNVIDRDEANKHLRERLREKGAIGY